MKRKLLAVLLTVTAALCLSFGLASCGDDDWIVPEFNTAGASAEKLVAENFEGYSAVIDNHWQDISADYTDNTFDIVYPRNSMKRSFYRNGKCFQQTSLKDVSHNTNIENVEYGPITYVPSDLSCPTPQPRAAAYGMALMVSSINNHKYYLRDLELSDGFTEDGTCQGEIILNDFCSGFYDSWPGLSLNESLRKAPMFKLMMPALTQERLIELLTAISGFDLPIGENAARILQNAKAVEGQTAFEYLMSAFEVMYQGSTYREYVDEQTKYWEQLPYVVFSLFAGVENAIQIEATYRTYLYIAVFNEQGELTAIRRQLTYGANKTPDFELTFTDTPQIKDIDDVEVSYRVSDYSGEPVIFRGTDSIGSSSVCKAEISFSIEDMEIKSIDSIKIAGFSAVTVEALGEFHILDDREATREATLRLSFDGRLVDGTITYSQDISDKNDEDTHLYVKIFIPYSDSKDLFDDDGWNLSGDSRMILGFLLYHDRETLYRAPVSEYAEKPLEEVSHKTTIPFRTFGYMRSSRENTTVFDFYADDEKFARVSYLYGFRHEAEGASVYYYQTIFDEPWALGSEIRFREEEDGYWAYKRSYPQRQWSKERASYYKMKTERPGFLFNYEAYLSSMTADEYYELVSPDGRSVEFEVDGISYRLDLSDFSCTFEVDGTAVTAKPSEDKPVNFSWSSADKAEEVLSENPPTKDVCNNALALCLTPMSVTVDSYKELDFYNLAVHETYWNSSSSTYAVEDGTVMEYYYENGAWHKRPTTIDPDGLFSCPLNDLVGITYEDLKYDSFDLMYYVKVDGTLYGIHFDSITDLYAEIDYIYTVSEGGSDGRGWFFSGYNSSAVELPQVSESKPAPVDFEKALQDSIDAEGYEAELTVKATGLVLKESFDFNAQIVNAVITNTKGESPLTMLRAVAEGKTWMYSDASGVWLRAETEGDPTTFISSANELLAIKNALDALKKNGSYTVPWDESTEEFTVGEFVVTVEDGYISSYRRGSGAAAVEAKFTKYNGVSLTLPTLGEEDSAVKEKFITAMRNTASAENFHAEWEINGASYSSDVIAGEKAMTTVSMTMGGTTIPVVEMYRELSGSNVDLWRRDLDGTSSTPTSTVWGSWKKQSMPETEAALRTDLFLQNCAYASVADRDPALIYIFAKYDEAAETFTIRDFNPATMSSVESTFKVENGYVTEWTTKNRDWVASLGASGDSLTFRYSDFGTAAVTKPDSIV